MIITHVNDCGFVGETLIKYLRDERWVLNHIKRARSLLDKTLGILWKVLNAETDIFHVHYLLQDCFLANKVRDRKVIGHAHGSDLRSTLKSDKWGWIVRSNLKDCDRILVSTPDILSVAQEYRSDAEYLLNPVDLELFYPKPPPKNDRLRVFYPCDLSIVKGTDVFIEGFARFQESCPNTELKMIDFGSYQSTLIMKNLLRRRKIENVHLIPKIPHQKMNTLYWESDIVCTDFKLGITLMTSLEAMACNRPVIQYINNELYGNPVPVCNARTPAEILEGLERLSTQEVREQIASSQLEYVKKYHDPCMVAKTVAEIYEELAP